ncbi:MAG: lamin tail domain-containing protein, partial [Candidatus Nealsonbacteria bacterium]|nr:lamin tail domain-containing protein [Candidatus Nealsonbacteria bacterium]
SVADSLDFEPFDLTAHIGTLHTGNNVLAIHGLNVDADDNNFLIQPRLTAADSPGVEQFFLFATPAAANRPGDVAINEIHLNPDVDTEQVEFVELHNWGSRAMDLSGWSFTDGVSYTFPPDTNLAAGGYLVVSQDPAAVQAKFGVASLGPYIGQLNNDGEKLALRDAAGDMRDEVDYQLGFPWPTVGDAPGSSFELIHPAMDNDLGGSWRSSDAAIGPTPGAASSVLATVAPPQMRQVQHTPEQPTADEDVTISVKVTDPSGVADVTLAYQLVDPGNYIRLEDAAYETEWTTVTMRDNGNDGDATAGDDVYTVVLPGTMQTHRRLVRYRITAADTTGEQITGPYADDPQPNFAYFVYDGVPAWTGADRPGVTGAVTYGTDVMTSLPAFHLISRESDVLDCQYNSSYNDKVFRFAGTLVVGEEVYDHVHYRIRGAGSTYVAGKNKWKFRFNRGHEFQGYDQYGNAWPEEVRTLNFGSLTSPWAPANRGMAGMDEALAYQLFNTTGVAAPYFSPLQFRVIDRSVEADPNNQYEGDLWGLYIAFENPGGRFLDSHGLPDGNLYRFDWSAELENQGMAADGTPLPSSLSFVNDFVTAYNQPHSVAWWRENVDVEGYYTFRAVAEALNHTDWTEKHNMLLFYNPETERWSMLPWDVDLLYEEFDRWGPDGMQSHLPYEQFRKMLGHEELNIEFQARARELQDLLLNDDQGWQMLEEYARYVEPMAAVDRAMWDYHPRAGSWHVGAYYQEVGTTPRYPAYPRRAISPVGFEGMVNWVKEFITVGGFGGDQLQVLHTDAAIPNKPTLTFTGNPAFPINGISLRTSPFADPQGTATFAAMEWRIGEVTDPAAPSYDPAAPIHYEVTPVWGSGELTTFDDEITLPPLAIEVGHAYRARVRMQDNTGRWSHWSDPVQFVTSDPNATALSNSLRITEIMYHPAEPTPAEATAGFTDKDQFEFIELHNIGAVPLDLSDVELTDGVHFVFGTGNVTSLAPDGYAVVVKDVDAFAQRYGSEVNVAGSYTVETEQLSNGGERITLADAQAGVLFDFDYNDADGWPGRADGKGASLVLIAPDDVPDGESVRAEYLSDPDNWQSSVAYLGTPGTAAEPHQGVVINEVLSHTDWPQVDAIELVNVGGTTVDLGGWFLSDSWGWESNSDNGDYKKFRIPDDTTLAPGQYVT